MHYSNHLHALPENQQSRHCCSFTPFLLRFPLYFYRLPLSSHFSCAFEQPIGRRFNIPPTTNMPSRTHILDLLILAVTFLYVIHSHSSASERNRPIRTTLTLGIRHLVSTRKPSHLSTQHPSKIHNKLYISLILIMHDIEINPGPRSPKFPCGVCHKAVTSSQRGVAYDTCDTWHHTTCMHMSSTVYESLHHISWHCISCSISQPTSSLPSSPSTNNSLSSLDISTLISHQQHTGLSTHNNSRKTCSQTSQNHQYKFPKYQEQNSRTW